MVPLLIIAALLVSFALQVLLVAASVLFPARILGVEKATFAAATKIGGLFLGACLLIGLPAQVVIASAGLSVPGAILLAIVAWVAMLTVLWNLIRSRFSISGKKAVGVFVTSTIITNVVGFCFGFALRNYVAEAFVIPTGAMAPTVLGAHTDIVCANCGRPFAVSMSDAFNADGSLSARPLAKHPQCKNCDQTVDLSNSSDIARGDRILVDRLSTPKRWDLAVFYIPVEKTTSYIKRLVGLPGEQLTIVDGDVFADGNRLVKQPEEQPDLWFFVNDTQWAPKTVDNDTPRWQSAKDNGWRATGSGWKISGASGEGAELVFSGLINDRLDYNAPSESYGAVTVRETLVGDVRILCDIEQFSGDGECNLVWQFDRQTVECKVRASGEVELSCVSTQRSDGNGVQRVMGKLGGDFKKPRQIGLAVRDGFAYVLDERRVCASLGIAPVKLNDIRPVDSSRGRASIRAAGCDLTIGRIQLARDVYYRQPESFIADATRFPIQLGPAEVFCVGDNSTNSRDSRYMGPSAISDVQGVARLIYWPSSRWRSF